MHIQHQRLIRAGLFGGNAGEDAVQLGVRVQLRVLRHGQAAHMGNSRQLDRARQLLAAVLHDDDHGRAALAELRMLKGSGLHAPRDHQARVGIVGHAIGFLCL